MPETINLSRAGLALLGLRLSGERVAVSAESLELYRELARAGLVEPVSGFAGGAEAHFRLTKAARELAVKSVNASSRTPR